MYNPILNGAMANDRQQDNERKLAAAELRRQAKAARYADASSDSAVAAQLPRMSAIDLAAGVWRSLGLRLVVVGRRQPA